MVGRKRDGFGETLRPAPSARLVFDSGLVSLDDPRIVPLREGYDELVARLLRPSAAGPGTGGGGRMPK